MTLRTAPFVLLLSLSAALAAQEPRAPAKATILKHEVDRLIHNLRASAGEDGSLGDGSCQATAKALTAAGHSHRFYHAGDGPWIRAAIDFLFTNRRADGAFADGHDDAVQTSRWVLGALSVMDPTAFAEEIERLRAFLEGRDAPTDSPFHDRMLALERQVADADDRIAALQASARGALEKLGAPGARPAPGRVVDALVELVAHQALARGDAPRLADDAAAWLPVQQQGIEFLLRQQEDGVFYVQHGDQRFPDPGLTAMALSALQTKPETLRSETEQSVIDQGLAWLLEQQNEDGSFGRTTVNYVTCASVMALSAADDPAFREPLQRAQQFILFLQNVEDRGYAPSDRDYGSIGYGGDERGDLSNLQFSIDALRRTGLDSGHEAFRKALVFLQRTQNLQEYNDFEKRMRSSEDGSWYETEPGNDGGAAYYPGNSPAGYVELPDGTRIPRSYGSMTYALLKAYTLCGLPQDDPRVRAAADWIRENWTLEVNPGVDPDLTRKASYQGLYYYYMVMAQALDLMDVAVIDVSGEAEVDWRRALREHLARQQREDGSWVNAENGRWWEDMPLICTSYSLLALSHAAP